MHTVLGKFRSIPGVLGTFVCGPDGRLVASELPPAFDEATVTDVARIVAEAIAGFATVTGTLRLFDLRTAKARIVARPVAGATLVFLCAPSTTLQPLEISASVAAASIEKLFAGPSGEPATAAPSTTPAVGKLHALVQQIDDIVRRKKLDRFEARGEIGLKAGFGLNSIDAETPDDPERLARLRAAASEILGERL